jgi:hypothetical protein
MKTQATMNAWLLHSLETIRLCCLGDFDAAFERGAVGERLWRACLADGWTSRDAEQALRAWAPKVEEQS